MTSDANSVTARTTYGLHSGATY